MPGKSFRALLLIAAAATVSLPAAAQTGAALTEVGPVREDALELARLLNPSETLVRLAGRSFDEAFDKGMASKNDGGAEALEKAYPGIIAALRDAIRETTLADLRAEKDTAEERWLQVAERAEALQQPAK